MAHSIYNLEYSVPKNVPVAFHNGSNYDYHFIIKELEKEFEKQFTCLWEKTLRKNMRKNEKKYKNFTVAIGKEVIRIDKIG